MPSNAQTLKKTDKISVTIGVDRSERAHVAKALSGLLASTYMLYLKTLYYHWNVTGSNFIGLHEFFEEQYQELHEAGDALAERVRALGHFTPGTVKEFMEMSDIADDANLPANSDMMVKRLLQANESCSKQARDVLKIAEDAKDEVTVDMMVARMTAHDKVSWMLRSILE